MIEFVKLESKVLVVFGEYGSSFDGEYDGLEIFVKGVKKRKIFKNDTVYTVNNFYSYAVKHAEKDKKFLVLDFINTEEIVKQAA